MKNTTSILLHFGLVVKDLRRKKQLSQEELANRCGLHRTYITDIEHGTRNVSLKNISKIAHAVEESLHDLFARVERNSQQGVHLIGQTLQQDTINRPPIEILLVEDDQTFIDQIWHELNKGKIGNKVHVVRNGEEALEFLFSVQSDENKLSSITRAIFLDLDLPTISGFEVLERIRKDKSTKDIPVVVLISSASGVDKDRCKKLGVEEYLTKPLNIDSLTVAMRRLGFRSLFLEREYVSYE